LKSLRKPLNLALHGKKITRIRRKPRSPDRGGMRVSSEALAKEHWSFGGLRRTAGATGSFPWGATSLREVPLSGFGTERGAHSQEI